MSEAGFDDTVLEEALEVLQRLPDGSRPREQAAVQRFMARSSRHRAAMVRVAALWERTEALTELPWPTRAELEADADGQGDFSGLSEADGSAQEPAATAAPLATGRSRWAAGFNHRSLAAAAAALGALVIGIAVVAVPRLFDGADTLTTATAEHRDVRLPDDSQMTLAARSAARVRYSGETREVDLAAGEALFAVRADPARRFTVRCGDAAVHAVGTVFDVRRRADQVVVAVLEGSVRVVRGQGDFAPQLLLRSGEQVVLDGSRGFGEVRQIRAADGAAWRDGWMGFDGEQLATVIGDISRYSAVPIVLADATAARLRYTGVVRLEQIDSWIEALPAVFAVEVRREESRTVIQSSATY